MSKGILCLLLLAVVACGGPSDTRFTIGGPFNDGTPMSCSLDGNPIFVRDGNGKLIGTTALEIAPVEKMSARLGQCAGKASWSVQVPKADYYQVSWESDQPVKPLIDSPLIPFAKLQDQGFVLHLIVESPPDPAGAHLIEVPP